MVATLSIPATLPRGNATQRPFAANNAMTMEIIVIGCDRGVDLRAGPGSVVNGRGRDPGHGIGRHHGRRDGRRFEEMTKMKSNRRGSKDGTRDWLSNRYKVTPEQDLIKLREVAEN